MNAYVAALDGQGTTMVLSPDSEFFRFFRNAEGTAPAGNADATGSGDGRPLLRRQRPRTHRRNRQVGDFIAAIGLVLVIEGLVYGGFPQLAKKLGVEVQTVPENVLRIGGLVAIAAGVGIVWLVRG